MCSWEERVKWLRLASVTKTKRMNTECDHVLMSPVIVEALRSEWACLVIWFHSDKCFYFIILCVMVFCLLVCLCTACMPFA